MQILNFGRVPGLTKEEQQKLSDLAAAYNYHQSRNAAKDKYYEGHITLNDVNLGIALPQGLRNLEVGCSWGQKAVDVLAARSMFDGFVGSGGSLDSLAKLVTDNRLVAEYAKACRDELKYGCVVATLSADAYLRFVTTLQDGDELQVYRENDLLRVQQLIDGKAYDVLSILDGSSTLWTVYHGAQAWQRTAKSGDGWLFLTLTMHAAYSTIITEGSNG